MSEKPPQNLEDIEEPKSPEYELSPEVLETVMAKVQDINEKGTAYTSVNRREFYKDFNANLLKNIMNEGILGFKRGGPEESESEESLKEEWINGVRGEKSGQVHFNIVGRTREEQFGGAFRMSEANYTPYENEPGNYISIIFDISRYKEVSPLEGAETTRTYKANDQDKEKQSPWFDSERAIKRKLLDKEGRPTPTAEYGFVLSHRIAPRDFRGIIFSVAKKLSDAEIDEKVFKARMNSYRSFNEESERLKWKKVMPYTGKNTLKIDWDKRADKISSIMLESNMGKDQNLVPVYDIYGNLCWPRQMKYEEVKKFVEDRDKNKENK